MEDIAVLISSIEVTASSMFEDAEPISSLPASTFSMARPASSSAARDASLTCEARRRNSSATMAKPRPASPARAASTEAFSARMFVWNEMSSMELASCEMLWALSLISSMAHTVRAIESLLSSTAPSTSEVLEFTVRTLSVFSPTTCVML